MAKNKVLSSQPRNQKLFKPKVRRNHRESSAYLNKNLNKNITFENFKNTNIFSEDSYRYGDKQAVVSTQEINIDYSDFTRHTFFHSAIAKVNESFYNILNNFPFDGSNKEIEIFEDQLTGFEKYVYDIYPKNIGYLNFSGSQKGESQSNGTYIEVLDFAGAEYTEIASSNTGQSKINPGTNPLNIQFFINIPKQANDNQVICQKRQSISHNWGMYLSASNDVNNCNVEFLINSGSRSLKTSLSVPKGKFIHITGEYHDCDQKSKITVIPGVTEKVHLFASSSNSVYFENISPEGNLNIGKGDSVRDARKTFDPQESLSGSMDDFRIFHRTFDLKEIKKKAFKSVSGEDKLAVYFKFNEPDGNYTGNSIVLDASGNSLNSTVKNYLNSYTRNTGSMESVPVKLEKIKNSPVLFPKYEKVVELNEELMDLAEEYDDYNPNLITKLIPPHYLDLGNEQDNYFNILGNLKEGLTDFGDDIGYKQNTQTSVQLLVKLLLTWAKFFDEIKIYIDHFSKINFVEYDEYETVSNKFLKRLGTHLGLDLPDLFSNGTVDQIFNGFNIDDNPTQAIRSLNELQNLVWRRILSDIANIKQTKGNLDSIRSLFRSSGIEAENIFNFREYGGSKVKSLESSREIKKDIISFLNFSGSNTNSPGSKNYQGVFENIPYLKSNFLSASRNEPGAPAISGQYINGISNNQSDGLLLTSSFAIQGNYLFKQNINHSDNQSLFRIHTTGSSLNSSAKEGVVLNLVANQNNLTAYVSDGIANTSISSLTLSDVNIFDGDIWSISLSKKDGRVTKNTLNDQYFLGATKYIAGRRQEYFYTSSFIPKRSDSVLSNYSANYNASGSFIIIGSQSLESTDKFINKNSTDLQKTTNFSGEVAYLNLWSGFKSEKEFIGYSKNPNSVGSLNPAINYNFSSAETGSFERLRIQTYGKQGTTGSNSSGEIRLFDFTQNEFHFNGSGFESNKIVMTPNNYIFEILSENFDLNSSKDKVRIRSLQSDSLLEDNDFAVRTPAFETPPLEETVDDTRFSIDMSAMKGLNENIMTMFSDFQPIENALGRTNSLFGEEYIDIKAYRKVYFNNLIEDLDLERYRSLFKWIDNSYTDIVYSLIPRTTTFMGINFIYESHVLERNKFKYLFDEIYLKALPRDPDRGTILLSQYVSKICKF